MQTILYSRIYRTTINLIEMKHNVLKQVCLCLLLFIFPLTVQGIEKSDKIKPKWLTQEVPESKSGTYIFVKAHGMGASIAEAKQIAFVDLSQKLESERGMTINTNLEISEILTQKSTSTNTEYKQEITLDVNEQGRLIRITCREIDDYWVKSDGKFYIDILYTVTLNNAYSSYDDDIKITNKYGAAGFLSIIPGVGQMYKGSYKKGIGILAGEIIAAGGILLCENTRTSYVKKMVEQPQYASEYNTRADSWETGRNICIGVAAALYVYNIIDAFTSNGAKRVIVKKKNTPSLSFVPYSDIKSSGFTIKLNF